MSLPSDSQHINSGAVAQGGVDPGQAPLLPFRTRLSLLRQRIILTLRWWFRLPIDEVREKHTQAQIDGLVELNQKQLETIQTLILISNHIQRRLQLYEQKIPRMRELKRGFDAEQKRLAQSARAASEDQSNGILALSPTNGRAHP